MRKNYLQNLIKLNPIRHPTNPDPGLLCDFSAKLFECKNCNTVETHNDIKITFDDEETYIVEWYCEECKGLQNIATKPITQYACKKCGSTLLKETGQGIWD